jgi:hypothetical protein
MIGSWQTGMNGPTQAARRVAVAQRIVAEQNALINRLKAAGRDTAGAKRSLPYQLTWLLGFIKYRAMLAHCAIG